MKSSVKSLTKLRGHDLKLIKQTCSVDATKYYFTNRVVNVVNSLPSHIVSSPTLSIFESRLGKHDFSSYLLQFAVYRVVYILVVFLFQVFNFFF